MYSIKKNIRVKVYMEGSVNYHFFKCKAEGEGQPSKGTQDLTIEITKGGPLPFAFDILAHAYQCDKVFTKYPEDIPDFFKQSLPEGFTCERVSTYEDGGVLSVTQETSLEGDCLICNVKVLGTNFPVNGPVMQRKTKGWEPSTEMVIPRDGGLLLRDTSALELDDKAHLSCFNETTCKSKKNVKLPELHFQHSRLERKKEGDGVSTIAQHECVLASYSILPSKLGHN